MPRARLAEAQRVAHWRAASVALLPWLVWAAVVAAATLRGRVPRAGPGVWLMKSVLGAGLIGLVAAAGVWLARRVGLPDVWVDLAHSLAALAIVAAIPGSAWWLRLRRPALRQARVRWAVEQIAGGASSLRAWDGWRGSGAIASTRQPWRSGSCRSCASDVESVAAIAAVLLAQVAIAWAIAGVIGTLAARWRVHWRSGWGWLAVLLWMAPLALIPVLSPTHVPAVGIAAVGASTALFGLTATRLRRQYRSTSEARRLVLRFGSLLVPILVVYPLASALADITTRTLIERDYGPATVAARQLDALMRTLELAQAEIDRVPNLERLARPGPDAEASSQAAFIAWNQTVLSQDRVTSEIELYDSERRLTSRFALNVPEFTSLYQMGEQSWQGRGCAWAAFSEVAAVRRRRTEHASRRARDLRGRRVSGRRRGAYRSRLSRAALRVLCQSVLRRAEPGCARSAGRALPICNWSCTAGVCNRSSCRDASSWPIDKEIDQSLSQSRQPFWRDREARGRAYHVYFLNDRAGVYALGYPSPTPLQHVTRLAEAAAVLVGLFVAYLAGRRLPWRRWRAAGQRLSRGCSAKSAPASIASCFCSSSWRPSGRCSCSPSRSART